MEVKINYQETYVSQVFLTIEFSYNNVDYIANATYYNGSHIEDIEVFLIYDYTEAKVLDEKINEIAKDLFEDMDIEKHITF